MRAWEAGGQRVALQVVVANSCSAAVRVTAAAVQPQAGFWLASDLAAASGLLPAVVQSRRSLCLGFLLAPVARASSTSPGLAETADHNFFSA